MIVLYIVTALLNWAVAGLYASEERWGFAAVWMASGAGWFVGSLIWARTGRIKRETERIWAGLR